MRRLLRLFVVLLCIVIGAPLVYAAMAFGALLLTPRATEPADGVLVYACDNGVHTDLVVPVEIAGVDLRRLFPPEAFGGPVDSYDHLGIGWGSRDFYINTPTWAEFDLGTAAGSLLWDETVLHVIYLPRPDARPSCRQWRADAAAQQRILSFIRQSLRLSGPLPVQAAPGYGARDAFFLANGQYTIIATCNEWTGQALRLAGAPVAPWTPFSFLVLWNLPMISS